jgi:Fe-S-cluster containining protein
MGMKQEKAGFKCKNCGHCCTKVVRLTKDDIRRISAFENDFVAYDPAGKPCIKMRNGYCIFLNITNGLSSCRIYDNRPKECRDYPFFKSGTQECKSSFFD